MRCGWGANTPAAPRRRPQRLTLLLIVIWAALLIRGRWGRLAGAHTVAHGRPRSAVSRPRGGGTLPDIQSAALPARACTAHASAGTPRGQAAHAKAGTVICAPRAALHEGHGTQLGVSVGTRQ
jgi:hypothetical protein